MNEIRFCITRTGGKVPFEKRRITNAINGSFNDSDEGNRFIASEITETVIDTLKQKFPYDSPSVENIQDVVEDTLIDYRFKKAAKAYIRYRMERDQNRKNS